MNMIPSLRSNIKGSILMLLNHFRDCMFDDLLHVVLVQCFVDVMPRVSLIFT